ncbi:MAG: M42 family metallopeptidase [Oscillospiraceae bacterium]
MNLKEILENLVNKNGVSGEENVASEYACKLIGSYLDAETDSFGNVYGIPKNFSDKKKTLLLDAHIDEIGMIVTYITDEGFLKVSGCGGIDNRLLLAQQVEVLCYGKTIKGVITSTPPHLEKDNTKVPETGEIYVDIGMTKEQAEKIVQLGDRVLIRNELISLENGVVTSHALDNRSGVAAIIYALELLKEKDSEYNICVLFSSQEEIGERGAKIGAYKINPDLSIVVDVSFAMTRGEIPENCGKINGGPMIGVAPSLSREMSESLINTAKKSGIPYQIEVMNGKTGTNADEIGTTRNGVKTCTVSIPLKYMHTPVEAVSLTDIENTGKLIAEFCEEGNVK